MYMYMYYLMATEFRETSMQTSVLRAHDMTCNSPLLVIPVQLMPGIGRNASCAFRFTSRPGDIWLFAAKGVVVH